MDKDFILENVADLSAEQLAEVIQQGIVTLDELKDTDELDATKRRTIKSILSQQEQVVENAWEQVKNGTEEQLLAFIAKYPSCSHIKEAEEAIERLRRQKENQQYNHQLILDRIKTNPNTFSPIEIQNFMENGTVSRSELIEVCGIPESAIKNLGSIDSPMLQLGKTPDSIPEGFTEVYFWGSPGSGKTCALGALLQMADYRRCLCIASGPGSHYAVQLKNIFSHDNQANDFLPPPSPLDTTQYLPFTLQKPGEKKKRSVSLIELSGEIFDCFFYKFHNLSLPTQAHEKTFDSLKKFLSSPNKKIHFFFIEAGRDNRKDGLGVKREDYLQAAAAYLNKMFNKTSDAIYVVLTKCDLLLDENGNNVPEERSKQIEYSRKFLDAQGYGSFIESLKSICRENSINGGRLTLEPFSLGKVYFQQICNFDGKYADRLLDILMERIPATSSKTSIFDFFNA